MANSFKTLQGEDTATTRTLLHEAIPITGTIVSGTYDTTTTIGTNIKTFSHGMYEAVYDYPYLSSSANHIFDITAGYSADCALSSTANTQNAKKINIYNQMAQVLVGYDTGSQIQNFDADGSTSTSTDKMKQCIFINFSRLLVKDEIKKNSFRLSLATSASARSGAGVRGILKTVGDYGAQTDYLTNSPAGEYGLLYTSSDGDAGEMTVGHVYYQAGIAAITASFFSGSFGGPSATMTPDEDGITNALTGTTISEIANGFRFAVDDISFNNTTELNSTIYFCRANNTEFNYSANPTYLSSSEIRVKGNNPVADPVSYITTVGLYSPDNELLAVAKLSEPLKKSPSNELTLRVRLDY
jgi:hypothetical protein